MTAMKKTVAVPNALILVLDSIAGELPDGMKGSLFAATTSCVAIGCRSDCNGETEIVVGSTLEVDPGEPPQFERLLDTPSRRLAVQTVLGETIAELPVARQRTMIRVWVNDYREPDRIIVAVE